MLQKLPDALGHALRDQRAGLEKIAVNRIRLQGGVEINVGSTVFNDYASIPRRYTADGDGLSPPLHWSNSPTEAASLLLIVEDADAPAPQPLVHAIVIELQPGDGSLEEGALRSLGHEGAGLKMGRNSYMQARWIPPDPPPGHGAHRYAFQFFALNEAARFSSTPGRDEVEEHLHKCAIASGCLIGTYQRVGRSGT
jgi:Raf kinase inhibitor-like YbhB/YbcL family protein